MTFDEFYERSLRLPPFDLATNPYGFPHREKGSCQSALMPILKYFASQCNSVVEFGCREGYSTAAIAKGLPSTGSLTSVDFQRQPIHEAFEKMQFPCKWNLLYKNIVAGDWMIPEVDWLHVDDLHTGEQVARELKIHGGQAKKYLSFHDTYSQGVISLDVRGTPGINGAIDEYTNKNGWKLALEVMFNHGLRVYERAA